MTTLLRAPLFLAVLAAASPGRADLQPSLLAANARWVAYANLDGLRQSAVGRELIAHVNRAQMGSRLPVQIDLPKVLATVGSVTAYGSSFSKNPREMDGTSIFQGTPDLRKIAEALLIQASLAHPDAVADVKDLGYSAYSVSAPGGRGLGVIVAFPTDRTVLVSRSEDQIRRARELLLGHGQSLAGSSDSPLRGLIANASGATLFAASVIPSAEIFPEAAPQARMLQMASAASVALGDDGSKTFAHIQLVASSEDNADKLSKILQGMIAMLSLTQSSDQQLTDFINSAVTERHGEEIELRLAYASDQLAEMVRKAESAGPEVANGGRGEGLRSRIMGQRIAAWSVAPAESAASPRQPVSHTVSAVALSNGARISLIIPGDARFEAVEVLPAGGGAPLVFSRQVVGQGSQRHLVQFSFPGEDGTYDLRVRVIPPAQGHPNLQLWVRNPEGAAPPSPDHDSASGNGTQS